MALPKVDLPTYKIKLRSLNREVVFRPFVVKEEKILMIALESEDYETTLNSLKQIISNCILTEGIDVDSLPLFELEYLFLNLRARSMGEKATIKYICENVVNEKKCKGEMEMEVDLLKVAVNYEQNVNPEIKLTDKLGMKMKYPTVETTRLLANGVTNLEALQKIMEDCTEYLYDEEQVYKVSEMGNGEFQEFLDNLTQDQFLQIQEFFFNMPKLEHTQTLVCKKCGTEHLIKLEGLTDFFD